LGIAQSNSSTSVTTPDNESTVKLSKPVVSFVNVLVLVSPLTK